MLIYKTATKEDREKAIMLSKRIFKDNMDLQFVRLFSEQNQNHMFLCKDDEEVVSMVNYYPSTIQLSQAYLRVASIGSVCTDPNYRGKSIASVLLKQAQEQMLKEDITVAIISGDGGIYEKFGSTDAGNMLEYVFHPKEDFVMDTTYQLVQYQTSYLKQMVSLYEKEKYRYLRTMEEFKDLFVSQTSPDTFADYPVFLIKKEEEIVAYVICFRHLEEDYSSIKEFAGDREALVQMIPAIMNELGKTTLQLVVNKEDSVIPLIQNVSPRPITLESSIKIIDLKGLIYSMVPYFREKVSEQNLLDFMFYEIEEGFCFKYFDASVKLNQSQLNRLVFGPNNDIINKIEDTGLKSLLSSLFPIPCVSAHNLNYQ